MKIPNAVVQQPYAYANWKLSSNFKKLLTAQND